MSAAWSPEQLQHLDTARELEITVPRADGTVRPSVPIWVVVADGDVLVRTLHRRSTGWYGRAIASGRARIRLPEFAAGVAVTEVGAWGRRTVDTAFRVKYGASGSTAGMVSDEASATTLRLDPVD